MDRIRNASISAPNAFSGPDCSDPHGQVMHSLYGTKIRPKTHSILITIGYWLNVPEPHRTEENWEVAEHRRGCHGSGFCCRSGNEPGSGDSFGRRLWAYPLSR
jgi:hypothetical protein